ncbi:hypothetical protein [Parvibaculum sp.]|nr:hypothetical protein [Parvibaculum sp.]MBO6634395.1 hypothetical protein [Parvibaculum sp.]MBO6680148.1 hypothetical protein [Parvibaculum sp.]MBO6683861.1 hypothetical protein [Parvibaculum sp.]MBO6904126.1 hypothetical protein [Parvibaculum sp.]
MKRKKLYVGMFILLLALVSLLVFIRFSTFMEIDNCLDSGGAWIDEACRR